MDEVPAYTRDDYLTTTKPFEYLYAHKENKFEMKQLLGRMSAQAQTVGIRNLAALFKAYMETVSGTVTPGYNKTDFSGQEMELDCGGWSASDTGIYGTDKMGFEVVACYHPIMPVQRLVNIDTGIHKVKLAFSLGRRWGSVIEDRNVISDSRSIIGLSSTELWSTARRVSRWFDIWPTWNSLITNKSQRFPVLAGWDGSMTMVFPLTLKT